MRGKSNIFNVLAVGFIFALIIFLPGWVRLSVLGLILFQTGLYLYSD